ncbi:Apc15p protein-domain-containing protein [Aspergillus bertholletiae]|uniref:Apc15p protein-domain-containing protein n=1 Tax=Aspergillus bertholletiae TaxID=1226010 RepID=A0A5N7BAC3_9EURO|nr:Apc15p protein-domain-containing protein [Aspergillus bertholletiae]
MNGRPFVTSITPGNTLSSLVLEERALRARKNNIASFGYSWIKPAGCTKTMLGMKEEEAEREEALAAADAEMAAAAVVVDAEAGAAEVDRLGPQHDDGQDDTGMERDLDDDIPDADAEGLVEEGEEGLEEDGVVDEEEYMERDLDDDIPEAFPDDDDQIDDDFDNQPDLDDDIPSAEDMDDEAEDMSEEYMGRDLDNEIPEAAENQSEQEDEWQHTDTDAELDDEDETSFSHDPFAENLRASTTSSHGLPPAPVHIQETEAQRRFLQRWSGGGDVFDTSGMMIDEDDLRASVTSQGSRRSFFSRFPRRRAGGPRDSFD